MSRASQSESASSSDQKEWDAQPKALALSCRRLKMLEHYLVTGDDFAPARKILSEALLHLFGHLARAPLHLFLHGAQLSDFALPLLNCFLAIPLGFTLVGSEKSELDSGHCLFQPVEPVVVHLRKEKEQEASQSHHGESSNARAGKRA